MMGRKHLTRGAAGVGAALVIAIAAMVAGGPNPVHEDQGKRLVISVERKQLWLVQGRDTVFAAPVAVGKGETFQYADQTYVFETPRGKRRVLRKETDPLWTVPDWNYMEKAAARGLELVYLSAAEPYSLRDGTIIEIRGDQVGRINRFGNWWPFTPGTEIIFDGKIFVPPLNTAQRKVPDALGPYKLDMGDGYLIHGTHQYNRDSIGTAASHGCVRMRNDDLEVLYGLVEVGTPVYII